MDFFDEIKDKKLFIILLSLVLNIILLGVTGYLFYNKFTHICPVNECKKELYYDDINEEEFYVEIKGEVNKPGVYKVKSNNIINDVVIMADGFTKKAYTKNINLSKKLVSELVIYVYSKDDYKKLNKDTSKIEYIIKECVCPTYDISNCITNNSSTIITDNNVDNASDINSSDKKEELDKETIIDQKKENKLININTCKKEELMTLTGIGESKADAIIEYRNKSSFNTIEDIKKVSGIGDSVFEKIKDNITV